MAKNEKAAPAAENVSNDTQTNQPAPVATQQPTSENLTAIDAKIAAGNDALMAATTIDERMKAAGELFKLNNERTAELNVIAKNEAALKVQNERNARVKSLNDLIDEAISGGKETEAFKALHEAVTNLLLPNSGKAATSTASTGTKSGGQTSKEIVDLYVSMIPAPGDMSQDAKIKKDIEAMNYARGTVGSAILAYQKAQGWKS